MWLFNREHRPETTRSLTIAINVEEDGMQINYILATVTSSELKLRLQSQSNGADIGSPSYHSVTNDNPSRITRVQRIRAFFLDTISHDMFYCGPIAVTIPTEHCVPRRYPPR